MKRTSRLPGLKAEGLEVHPEPRLSTPPSKAGLHGRTGEKPLEGKRYLNLVSYEISPILNRGQGSLFFNAESTLTGN